MVNLLEVASDMQHNSKLEADAVLNYTQSIKMINESNLDTEKKEDIIEKIEELIADELNHQNVLQEIYTALTDIKAKLG